MKKIVFNLGVSLPALLLAYILFPFLSNLYCFYRVSPEAVVKEIHQALQGFEFPTAFVRVHTGRPLIRSKNENVIYVYGGSSLIVTNSGAYPHNVFPGKLQEALKGKALVSNFGRSGMDSFYARDIFKYTCKIQKPDLVILYAGHNDYTNIYRKFVRRHYSLLKGTLLRSILRARSRFHDNADWHLDYNFEPIVDSYCAARGLLAIDFNEFLQYDSAAEGYYQDNIRQILGYAKENGISVLLITPVGNLYKKPVGNKALLQAYERAVSIPDYSRRIAMLSEVRDRDFLAPDIRAKTPMLRFLRTLEDAKNGIHVLDLEQELMKIEFSFNNDGVYDYFHLTEATHEVIKDMILRELKKKALLKERLRP